MSIKVKGDKELQAMLGKLMYSRRDIAAKALYEGAKVIADAVASAARSLPTDEGSDQHHHIISAQSREELANSVGIATFQDNPDQINTLIGFNGYLSRTEKKYPNGLPAQMVARSIESGSSFRAEHPFVQPAVRAARRAALRAMDETGEREIRKITNES